MNKKYICIIFILCLNILIFSCGDSDDPDDLQNTWSFAGTAALHSVHSNQIKLAAFLIGSNADFTDAVNKVSNTVNLSTSLDFALNINTVNEPVNNGDTVDLVMWEDNNLNNSYDAGELWQYTEPQIGCPVFADALKCCFFYSSAEIPELGIAEGWNLDRGNFSSLPIAGLQGIALIQDWNEDWSLPKVSE